MSGSFGNPLTLQGGDQGAPGFVLVAVNSAAATDSGFVDCGQFESLVVNAATGIGAGNQVTVTFQWADQSGTTIMGTTYLYTLVLDSAASSMNAVRIRNLGPYVRVTTTVTGGPAFTMTVWGSNRLMAHEGPYCEVPNGTVLHSFNASVAAGGVTTETCGGTGRTFGPQYCGPATLTVRGSTSIHAVLMQLSAAPTPDIGGVTNQTANALTPSPPTRLWVPAAPFQLAWINGDAANPKTLIGSLVAGW